MNRQSIKGYNPNHPNYDEFSNYQPLVPEGKYKVQLDFHAWGKSTNLFCFFTDIDSGEKYRLSVFSRQDYKPYNGSIPFDEEPVGGHFYITVKSKNSEKPSQFLDAEKHKN